MIRRLWRASIWHPSAIPPLERKYAVPLKRVVFPVYDVLVMALGVLGLAVGFRAIRDALPETASTVLYCVLFAAGFVCFISAAFPRLWVPEILGKIVILSSLGVIVGAMLVAVANVPGYSGATVIPVMVGMMLIPLLRLWILGVELANRERRGA